MLSTHIYFRYPRLKKQQKHSMWSHISQVFQLKYKFRCAQNPTWTIQAKQNPKENDDLPSNGIKY